MLKKLVGLSIAVAALASPGPASAAVTIGSDLEGTPDFGTCSVDHICTVAQFTLSPTAAAPGGGPVASTSGVVTRFRVKSGPTSTANVFLRILRPAAVDPDDYTGAGTSAGFLPPPNAVSPSFPVRLPINSGDRIGLNCCHGATNDILDDPGGMLSDSIGFWGIGASLALADGESPFRSADSFASPRRLMLQADIELDGDGDGFGDETQDLCPGNASVQTACPVAATVTTPAKRCRKGFKLKKVRGKKKKRCVKKKKKKR